MNDFTPREEIQSRIKKCTHLLQQFTPDTDGILIFSRLNIFYFSGSFVSGALWIPLSGDPILFCRRGIDRARQESSIATIVEFKSYSDIGKTLISFGFRAPTKVVAEMNGLSWALSSSLQKHLPNTNFSSGDRIIAMTRAVKSEWELQILRQTGEKHNHCLSHLLPSAIAAGMDEFEIGRIASNLFYSEGHQGILRMEKFGEEIFFGHIAIGESANHPSVFNGPVGLKGMHPAVPFMGSASVIWKQGQPLTIDNGFSLSGYQTDKTQVYWLGSASTLPSEVMDAHNFCVEMQAMVAKKLQPGAIPSEIWQACTEMVHGTPWVNGFMGLSSNKVHFVGHGIGLAIDEYPVLARGFNAPLEEGMVLAVEPKIGIEGFGMVGTENTFEITGTGGSSITGFNNEIICVE